MLRERGQTQTIGSVLLVGIVVVVAGGLYVTGSSVVDDAQRQGPSAAFTVGAAGSIVQLTHESGDQLTVSDVVVVFAGTDSSRTRRVDLSAFADRGNGDGRMTAGESFTTTNPLPTGAVTVRVVHRPSELVLAKRSLSVDPGVLDFAASATSPTATSINRDSPSATIAVEDGGTTANATGNGWWVVPYSYNVTPDTMLSFTFSSQRRCEIHGIGLEDDDRQTSGRVVQVYGSQSWGEPVSQFDGQSAYGGSGPTSYTVPVGELYEANGYLSPGSPDEVDKLLFVNDCDGGPTSSVNSRFSNVRVYEAS